MSRENIWTDVWKQAMNKKKPTYFGIGISLL